MRELPRHALDPAVAGNHADDAAALLDEADDLAHRPAAGARARGAAPSSDSPTTITAITRLIVAMACLPRGTPPSRRAGPRFYRNHGA
jgi:hypothetical protein